MNLAIWVILFDTEYLCKPFISPRSLWTPFWRTVEQIRRRWDPAPWCQHLQRVWSALSRWRHVHGVRLGPEERTGGWLSLLASLRGSTHPHRTRQDQPPPKETCRPGLLKVVNQYCILANKSQKLYGTSYNGQLFFKILIISLDTTARLLGRVMRSDLYGLSNEPVILHLPIQVIRISDSGNSIYQYW